MTPAMIATLVILIAAIVVFVSNRVPPALVALGVALALFLTGVVSFEEAIAGFGEPVVVYLAALFVVSEALDSTGVTADGGQPSSPARVRARRWLPPARRLASSRG